MKLHLINQKNLLKNSISLVETLISLIILSIVVSGFLNISSNNDRSEIFHTINNLENSFVSKNYQNFNQTNSDIKIIRNGISQSINVKKYHFDDENLKVFKYEK